MTATQKTLAQYGAYLAMIVGGWFLAAITGAHSFAALGTQAQLMALSVLVVTWLVACASHFSATGSLDPVAPAKHNAAPCPPLPAPPHPPPSPARLPAPPPPPTPPAPRA